MKRTLLVSGVIAALGVAGIAQAAGDAAAGKARATTCAGCHGAGGEGKAPNPALAGMPEEKFIQAIQDYKSGKRANAIMKTFAGQLKSQDVENLAAYYSSLKKK
jgi:cytochrome c553